MDVTQLSNEALLSALASMCFEGHRRTARLLLLLAEIEKRELHLDAGCTSLYDFCVERLSMSEAAAYRRIAAARVVARFPALLARVERGELHLSSLVILRDHLTPTNVDELVTAAVGKTTRQVAELVAAISPKPDVPSKIRRVAGSPSDQATAARVAPLAPDRYKVQLTVSSELRKKLEHASDLMSHSNPKGDLAVVLDAALDLLIDHLERTRRAKADHPRDVAPAAEVETAGNKAIPRLLRREVFERDGSQCTFVSEDGHRCTAKRYLQIDHVIPIALGGTSTLANLRVLCGPHNRLMAIRLLGIEPPSTAKVEGMPDGSGPGAHSGE
jgi:hypothetical protein